MSRTKKKKSTNSNPNNNSNCETNYKKSNNSNKKIHYNRNQSRRYNSQPTNELVRRVQSEPGIGSRLVLFSSNSNAYLTITGSASKFKITTTVEKVSEEEPTKYQLKINNVVYAEAVCEKFSMARRELSKIALAELQKVCFSIVKKHKPENLPKVKISSSSESKLVGGIGAKIMGKMGWSGKGLGSQEQGSTDIIQAYFNVNRQGLGNQNITAEVWALLKEYSESQELNPIAFSPDFTKDERAAIHLTARRLNLQTRSYGKDEQRFLIVENKIRPWDLVCALLDAGGESEQFKLIIPTNFL